MKIALLGYGKMGKAIEKIAVKKEHEVVYKTSQKIDAQQLSKADVAIDFSVPEAAFENITTCFKKKLPVVSGTTGWLDKFEETVKICKAENGAFLYASNFSIGVNLFFELNEHLAKTMHHFPNYQVKIEETHHTEKKDAPSGTAISLAEQIIEQTEKTSWKLLKVHQPEEEIFHQNKIPIAAKRIVDVPGTHKITYASPIDDIEIKHTAHSRAGFAAGAVMAAEWLPGKSGVFGMKDVLKSLFLR